MKIDSFKDGFAFLSNFFIYPVIYKCITYLTSEHAYQCAKTLDAKEQEWIRSAPTPGQAKRRGKKATCRPDWEQVKFDIMHEIVLQKFQNPTLKRLLIETGNNELIEGNQHADKIWGCVWENGKWAGENHLGRILMQIRQAFKC
jgi:hypothetical protein